MDQIKWKSYWFKKIYNMKFVLPLPPSINRTYGVSRNGDHAMYKRKPVKDWEFTAGWEIKRQMMGKPVSFSGPVKIGIAWYYQFDRDIDAGFKVLLDLFEKQQIYKNDRQVREVMYIRIFKDVKNPRVEIELYDHN